ncbi:MAG: helix-turn-helix domain-containing protein [Treponema sp.]|nr:helix-turn-helix domain-containing protein [Treponema sp.]
MNISFINKVEEILRIKGMSQKELASRIGVSEVTVSRWLNGERNPSVRTVEKLAEVLETSASYLLSEEKENLSETTQKSNEDSVNWGALLAGTALTATAVIGIVAIAKAMGKLNESDKEQIENILSRD